MKPDELFQTVTAAFAELGVDDSHAINHTLLLRDGFFVGHRFRCGDLQATWSPQSDAIEFFSAAGELLRSAKLDQQEVRKSA